MNPEPPVTKAEDGTVVTERTLDNARPSYTPD